MMPSFRLSTFLWALIAVACLALIVAVNTRRAQRVVYVSQLPGGSAQVDASSPTGYANGKRQLLVAEHDAFAYQWIAQAQQTAATGVWALRHGNADNAPKGREIRTTAPYRLWLLLNAALYAAVSDDGMGRALERAALFADPVLLLLLCVTAGLFAARHWGRGPAALLLLGLGSVYPFAGAFAAGQPDEHSLALFFAFWSVLPLLLAGTPAAAAAEGSSRTEAASRRGPRDLRFWFAFAGISGGLGLWTSLTVQLPVTAGVLVGALAVVFINRVRATSRTEGSPVLAPADATVSASLPWLVWGIAGAGACFLGWALEGFPGGLRSDLIHPIYALGFLAAGALPGLVSADAPAVHGRRSRGRVVLGGVLAGLVLLGTLAFFFHHGGHLASASDNRTLLLTKLGGAVAASNGWAWIREQGIGRETLVTLAPLLVVLAGFGVARRSRPSVRAATPLLLAAGPVLVLLVVACCRLRAWSALDAMLLLLLLPLCRTLSESALPALPRRLAFFGAALGLGAGVFVLVPKMAGRPDMPVNVAEVQALIERDLAHWLATQSGGKARVLASPSLSASLSFHGGLQVLASPYPDNSDGLTAALRLASSTLQDEAHALIQRRQLTHIVTASWDRLLSDYAALRTDPSQKSLMALLDEWVAPRWLRAVAYQVPQIAGFEGHTVGVFEVMEVQENAEALSRLAEYFVEMNRMDEASAVARALAQHFPKDPQALIARAQVAVAQGNSATYSEVMRALLPLLDEATLELLPWDRKVSLIFLLATGQRFDLAGNVTRQCLVDADEARIRFLSTAALYRFLFAAKALQQEFTDPELKALALSLLPTEMRARL